MLGDMMMGRKLGMMSGGMGAGGDQVHTMGGMPPVNMNLGVQPNYWQGNQLQIPGLAQMLQRFAPQQPQQMQQQAPMSPFAEMLRRVGPNGRVPMIGNEFLKYMQQR